MTVWLRGSRPFSTRSRFTVSGKQSPTFLKADAFRPVDGSEPTYWASSGTAVSSLKAPTMKNVKSAAFAKRSR